MMPNAAKSRRRVTGAREFMSHKYKMTISRLTVDKLGVKLYDRVSAVIAEIVANSYDADATQVVITAPMGQLLANKTAGKIQDRGFTIDVSDDGSGMTSDEVNAFYLKVGSERRADPKRGDVSKKWKRRVMGRKGVGKLAPFGVCECIEVLTAGGPAIKGKDEAGQPARGSVVSHLILEKGKILNEVDTPYFPKIGTLDATVRKDLGTTIKLRIFGHRWVPTIDEFERQLAQRFGLPSGNWKITLRDSQKKPGDDSYERVVGTFDLDVKKHTKITFSAIPKAKPDSRDPADYKVEGPKGVTLDTLEPGFSQEGAFFPVTGWVGYAEKPYKDDLMAGVRIYCRGKIAAQTAVFNLKAGFTGEHDIRSYLIGELHADWLDEAEDLIRTDRQDILWSHDLGSAFQSWGQALVKSVGKITREPMRVSAWEKFVEVSQIETRVAKEFPGAQQKEIRNRTLEMAQTIASRARPDELEDAEVVESFVQLSLLLGPHVTLDKKLREAAASKDRPLAVVSAVLQTARIAELASFGRIADDRVKVIETLGKLKDDTTVLESTFQQLLSDAPWLIDPRWAPITANQSFQTLKEEFAKYYKKHTGNDLVLDPFADPSKRADFVLSSQDSAIQIIEIKRPGHALQNEEMDRINKYYELMSGFLEEPGNKEFKAAFPYFRITLVCDKLSLTGVHKSAFEGLENAKTLIHVNWRAFLLRTRQMHEAFLNEAERQKRLVGTQKP
jgi:hypothetical protein